MKPVILFLDNSAISEVTDALADYDNSTATVPRLSTDAIFIGSKYPFNSIFLKPSTVNSATSAISLSLWDGSTWRPVSRLRDGTSVGGKTLAQSGHIQFDPDKYKIWSREDTVDATGNDLITGIVDVTLYDYFWLKIVVNNTLSSGTALGWVGQIFSTDDNLGAEYPDLVLTATKTAFEAAKTNWEEQHVKAAEILVSDLKNNNVLNSSSQILNHKDFMLASVAKVAEIIFNAFGDAYKDQKIAANAEYRNRVQAFSKSIDQNLNALEELEETVRKPQRFFR
jgi:hypothetical protein